MTQSAPIIQSLLPPLAVLASLVAVIPIVFFGKKPNIREGSTLLAGAVKLALVLAMLPKVLDGNILEFTLFQGLPGVPIQFRVDGLGMIFALVASSLWIVTSIYSMGYMRPLKEHSQTRYYAFFAISLTATLGVAFAGNLLTLYLFYEMLSMATYPLVTHNQDSEARSGGRKYLTYLLGTSVGLALPAMIYCYSKTGSMNFTDAGFMAGHTSGTETAVLLVMFVFGFSKAGIMPFHSWLPGAMVAPTPVSSLLHAVAVVKVGVFCIIRVITGIFGVQLLTTENLGIVVSWIAGFTVITSSLIALSQDNLKRRLAFSTIGQLSYIVLGASILTSNGVNGSMVHIAMHAFGKITLFFCAGAIYVATGKKYISQMKGIGHRMPITMICFLIGSMSVIGLPPTGGFVSKWYMLLGAADAGNIPIMTVYLVSSLLNAAYFLPIVYQAFFCDPEKSLFEKKFDEAPRFAVIPLVITATGSVALFFFSDTLFQLARLITG